MFAVHIFALYQQWDGRRYGSVAPDWFDEAPAIWMESDADRSLRLDLVIGARPALATLLTMEHPQRPLVARDGDTKFQILTQTITPPCPPCTFLPDSLRTKYRVTRVRLFPMGHADTVTTYEDRDPTGRTTFEEKQFYPLAYSLLLYIHTRGGSAAVRELIARYRADPSARTDVLNTLPGLASSFAEIERDWHQFLATEIPARK